MEKVVKHVKVACISMHLCTNIYRYICQINSRIQGWRQIICITASISDAKNAANFESIQQSIVTISLDKPIPNYTREKHFDIGCWNHLAGGGSHLNTGNRWCDKILQVYTVEPALSSTCIYSQTCSKLHLYIQSNLL